MTTKAESAPAPGSPRYEQVLDEIRSMMIELTRKADEIGWDWELNSRPLNGRQRRYVLLTEKGNQP